MCFAYPYRTLNVRVLTAKEQTNPPPRGQGSFAWSIKKWPPSRATRGPVRYRSGDQKIDRNFQEGSCGPAVTGTGEEAHARRGCRPTAIIPEHHLPNLRFFPKQSECMSSRTSL